MRGVSLEDFYNFDFDKVISNKDDETTMCFTILLDDVPTGKIVFAGRAWIDRHTKVITRVLEYNCKIDSKDCECNPPCEKFVELTPYWKQGELFAKVFDECGIMNSNAVILQLTGFITRGCHTYSCCWKNEQP